MISRVINNLDNKNNVDYKLWDLGEEDIITPSKENLYKILNAIILCDGSVKNSFSSEVKDGNWRFPARSCTVTFRVGIPIGNEKRFVELTGFKPSEPEFFGGY